MIQPLRTELKTIPFDISSAGDNVVIPYYDFPVNGIDVEYTFIHKLKINPTNATDMVFKAVNSVTGATRQIFDENIGMVAGQALIYENSTDGEQNLYRLYKNEELVVELSAAVRCTGFANVSYII